MKEIFITKINILQEIYVTIYQPCQVYSRNISQINVREINRMNQNVLGNMREENRNIQYNLLNVAKIKRNTERKDVTIFH